MSETQWYSSEQTEVRDSLKEFNIDLVEQQGGIIYEVKEWDTLWDVIKTEFGITDSSEIANQIIQITKINTFNNTLKKDSLSVIDWKTLIQKDGIPWDLIIPWEKLILKTTRKWLTLDQLKDELSDTNNDHQDVEDLIEELAPSYNKDLYKNPVDRDLLKEDPNKNLINKDIRWKNE